MYERIYRPRTYSLERELVLLNRNSGTARDWYRRHARLLRKYHTNPESQSQINDRLFVLATHPALLKYCWDYLERSPTAPGSDGICYGDIAGPDRWAACRNLSTSLRSGEYLPQPERAVRIPKPGNRGHRTITVQSIFDRIVQRALTEVLQPLLDPTFHRLSFGFRPHRDRTHALAAADYLSITHNLPVWVLADLRTAFDCVPLPRLLEVVETRVPSPDLLELVQRLVHRDGGDGLRQGSPLSPLLLNLYLDHFLDRPWEEQYPDTPLLRYADDLLILCRTSRQAIERRDRLDDLLRPTGLRRKEMDPSEEIVRVNSVHPANWLGFEIRATGEELEARVAPTTLEELRQHIDTAYSQPNAPLHIRECIAGWLAQQGPCFKQPQRHLVHSDIEMMIQPEDLHEIQSPNERDHLWELAHARWQERRASVRKSLRDAEPEEQTAAS